MPYLDPSARDVYYRCWDVPRPAALVLFAHGFGEQLDLYHRLAAALGAQDIETWGLELPGHGRSAGSRGIVPLEPSLDALAGLAARATSVRRGVRMVAMGHSLGSIVVATAVVRGRVRADGLLLSAPPLDGVTMDGLLTLPTPADDPFYLDLLANDPYGFPPGDALAPLVETLEAALPGLRSLLPGLEVPVGIVSGSEDPFCTPALSARWAAVLPHATRLVVDGDRHDVLNDTRHRETEAAVAQFVLTGRLPSSG